MRSDKKPVFKTFVFCGSPAFLRVAKGVLIAEEGRIGKGVELAEESVTLKKKKEVFLFLPMVPEYLKGKFIEAIYIERSPVQTVYSSLAFETFIRLASECQRLDMRPSVVMSIGGLTSADAAASFLRFLEGL